MIRTTPGSTLHDTRFPYTTHFRSRIVACNNANDGTPFRLRMPGRGVNMGDGWETRRRREPGYDWCIIELGHASNTEKIEIDTAHFKGNYPDRISEIGRAHV